MHILQLEARKRLHDFVNQDTLDEEDILAIEDIVNDILNTTDFVLYDYKGRQVRSIKIQAEYDDDGVMTPGSQTIYTLFAKGS